MLFLLDANTLIDANRDYYRLESIPQFWDWLKVMGKNGNIKIPIEIHEELKKGNDKLAGWVKEKDTENALLYTKAAAPKLVQQVLDNGYGRQLTDIQIEKIGRDPFLISYALNDIKNIVIVTTENSKPTITEPSNKKIPDVCKALNIKCIHTFVLTSVLNFRT